MFNVNARAKPFQKTDQSSVDPNDLRNQCKNK